MYYTIYKTTNIVNNKIYLGKHEAKNLDDNYLGSGHALHRAIKKYGKENFKRETLFIFDNPVDMFAKEKELVNEEFVAKTDNYNIALGGLGSFYHINSNPDHINPFKGKTHSKESKEKMSRSQRKIQNLPSQRTRNSLNQIAAQNRPEVRKAKSDRTKEYMSDPNVKEKHKNSCNSDKFKAAQRLDKIDSKFVYDPNTLETKRTKDYQKYLDEGWILGFIRRKNR